mmetsp:Transcript_18857/g.56198  ORF Transcript_18857/g.56198 Transcript_18857/m.56198 type:complete len:277 (-) Transcript_18857:744-1574(-)
MMSCAALISSQYAVTRCASGTSLKSSNVFSRSWRGSSGSPAGQIANAFDGSGTCRALEAVKTVPPRDHIVLWAACSSSVPETATSVNHSPLSRSAPVWLLMPSACHACGAPGASVLLRGPAGMLWVCSSWRLPSTSTPVGACADAVRGKLPLEPRCSTPGSACPAGARSASRSAIAPSASTCVRRMTQCCSHAIRTARAWECRTRWSRTDASCAAVASEPTSKCVVARCASSSRSAPLSQHRRTTSRTSPPPQPTSASRTQPKKKVSSSQPTRSSG